MTRAGRIAFVCPRLAGDGMVGGAEILLKQLALRGAKNGRAIDFLTTCAIDHFTWENHYPPGVSDVEGMRVHRFPVDKGRDLGLFLNTQEMISRGSPVSDEEERAWIDHNVNSRALLDHLQRHVADYDRIIMGPYLFGLVWHAARICPEKTLLVPCLHDEPFARLRIMKHLLQGVKGILFNTEAEQRLAHRLFVLTRQEESVVGIGLDSFSVDPTSFARRGLLDRPYLVYAGRREPLKGTPLLTHFADTFRRRTGRDIALVFMGSGKIQAPPTLLPHLIDLGYVSEEEKHEAMAGALAFVHPSVNESLGIVILESWLAGTPCLVNGHCEVLTDLCRGACGGLWWDTYPAFEEEVVLLLERPDLRDALGASGRAFVERNYSWGIVDTRLFNAIDAA